jgi:hypothetical protein
MGIGQILSALYIWSGALRNFFQNCTNIRWRYYACKSNASCSPLLPFMSRNGNHIPNPAHHTASHRPFTHISLPSGPQTRHPQQTPSHQRPQPRPNTNQYTSPDVPTIHEYLQRSNVVYDDCPTYRRCTTRKIIVPYYQEYREELRTTADQQRSAQRCRARKVRYTSSPHRSKCVRKARGIKSG